MFNWGVGANLYSMLCIVKGIAQRLHICFAMHILAHVYRCANIRIVA